LPLRGGAFFAGAAFFATADRLAGAFFATGAFFAAGFFAAGVLAAGELRRVAGAWAAFGVADLRAGARFCVVAKWKRPLDRMAPEWRDPSIALAAVAAW
jgi:hypothetical protein